MNKVVVVVVKKLLIFLINGQSEKHLLDQLMPCILFHEPLADCRVLIHLIMVLHMLIKAF